MGPKPSHFLSQVVRRLGFRIPKLIDLLNDEEMRDLIAQHAEEVEIVNVPGVGIFPARRTPRNTTDKLK